MKIVKSSLLSLLGLAISFGSLSGCSAMKTDDPEPDHAGRVTGLGRTLTKGQDVATDSYISQINSELARIKGDGGEFPATLEDAKRTLKFPEEMWVDKATKKPLVYNPQTGTVSR
jgi:hypothetical protein